MSKTLYQAHVISIFKKTNQCSNYQSIYLLNTGYKLDTKVINESLKIIAEALLLEDQSGFRKQRSCTFSS
jgi:hypothetical protein